MKQTLLVWYETHVPGQYKAGRDRIEYTISPVRRYDSAGDFVPMFQLDIVPPDVDWMDRRWYKSRAAAKAYATRVADNTAFWARRINGE
jgi:hypothetical protein